MILDLEFNVFELSILMAFVADGTSAGQALYNSLKDTYQQNQHCPGHKTRVQLSEKQFLRALNAIGLHAPGCLDHKKVFQYMLQTWNQAAKHNKKWQYDRDGDVIMR